MKRVDGVDSLRGLLACGVMTYHYLHWAFGDLGLFERSLEVFSVACVETFFIISGFSLYYVYSNKTLSLGSIKVFFIKRFFRIAPLFYFCLFLTLLLKLIAPYFGVEVNRGLELMSILGNITFLFGFISPSDSLIVAGWSIGVEMAFYSIFPILLTFSRSLVSLSFLLIFSLIISTVYSFYFLSNNESLTAQWPAFVSFPNHFKFFVVGILLSFLYKHSLFFESKVVSPLFFLMFFLFFVLGLQPSNLGVGRYFSLLICVFLVYVFCKYNITNSLLSTLGELSYSVYLTHFYVYLVLSHIIDSKAVVIGVSFVLVFFVSTVTYRVIEQRFIRLGKTFE